MQQLQSITSPQGSDESSACAACGAASDSRRCPDCGAARAPGGFRVLSLISRGPFGRVYLARGPDGAKVALKELVFSLVPDTQQLEAFEREAATLARLDHPGIPKLVASFQEGAGVHTRLYLAQELVEGQSLAQELATHRFSEAEARDIARQVLEVLAYLHGRAPKVLHRDLKPANLIRRPDGTLAVVDFGAARELVRNHTYRSTLVGTFGYMPPEQLGGTVDATSDLYALGATLAHLLSRKPPEQMLLPGMALDIGGQLSVCADFERFLQRLVAVDPRDRFASASEALAALDAEGPGSDLERPREVGDWEQIPGYRLHATERALVIQARFTLKRFGLGLGLSLPCLSFPLLGLLLPSEGTSDPVIGAALFGALSALFLFVGYLFLAGALGSDRIDVSSGGLRMRGGLLSAFYDRALLPSMIDQLYCREEQARSSSGEPIGGPSYALRCLLEEGTSILLLRGLTRGQALALETVIEERLGIADRPVAGPDEAEGEVEG